MTDEVGAEMRHARVGQHVWTWAAGALLLAGTLAGCSVFQGHPCAAVYESSGVNFDLTDVVDPAAGGTVRLCVDDQCENWDVVGRDATTSFLTINDLKTEQSVEVSALVTDAAGSTTFEASTGPPSGPRRTEPSAPSGEPARRLGRGLDEPAAPLA